MSKQNDEIGDYALVLVDTPGQEQLRRQQARAAAVRRRHRPRWLTPLKNYSNGKIRSTNTIVTYRVDEDGDYTLKAVDSKKVYETDSNDAGSC